MQATTKKRLKYGALIIGGLILLYIVWKKFHVSGGGSSTTVIGSNGTPQVYAGGSAGAGGSAASFNPTSPNYSIPAAITLAPLGPVITTQPGTSASGVPAYTPQAIASQPAMANIATPSTEHINTAPVAGLPFTISDPAAYNAAKSDPNLADFVSTTQNQAVASTEIGAGSNAYRSLQNYADTLILQSSEATGSHQTVADFSAGTARALQSQCAFLGSNDPACANGGAALASQISAEYAAHVAAVNQYNASINNPARVGTGA